MSFSDKMITELKWRGLMSQTTGNVGEIFNKPTTFYLGIDPTADSLGVHHMIGLLTARILRKYGHTPIILIGGATSAIGDPSGKTEERKVISMDNVFHNVECVKQQLEKIMSYNYNGDVHFEIKNNYDWMKDFSFLDFMRTVGKKITVNYMMAKENVKKRLERGGSGISCQEFIYGLIQGYDFVHLYQTNNCHCQIAGSDNISNIDTGIELLRKSLGVTDVCSITWDLITTAEGKKFGKSEGNTVWLDSKKTSPYDFMQFWINQSDADAEKFAKMFLVDKTIEEVEDLINEHKKNPSKRILQKALAHDVTIMVHGEDAYNKAIAASNILFGNSNASDLENLDNETFKSVMKDVPKVATNMNEIEGTNVVDFLCTVCKVGSKTDVKKLINGGGISINKVKVDNIKENVTKDMLLNNNTMLVQKGKKKYYLVTVN